MQSQFTASAAASRWAKAFPSRGGRDACKAELCHDENDETCGPSQARAVALSAMRHGSRRGVDHSC